MKIEEASPFLQVNALAQRARQLIQGAPPRVPSPLRRPAAVALAEMQAGKIEVYAKHEAEQIIEEDTRGPTEDQQAAREEARAALARMFGESDAEDAAPEDGAAAETQSAADASAPEAPEDPESTEAAGADAEAVEAPVEPSAGPNSAGPNSADPAAGPDPADPAASEGAAADEEANPTEAE